jgi:hypothetical protein
MSKNYSGLTIKIYYLEKPSDQPVASSYVLNFFFDFGQTFFPLFDDLVPQSLKTTVIMTVLHLLRRSDLVFA